MNNEKLILTLLVKNETDIIEDNILHHYRQGVDFIIVTDHESTDGTLDILRRFEKKKLIDLYHCREFEQKKVVNLMGRVALEKHKATILIHNDADEFWCSTKENNLKSSFLKHNCTSLRVKRLNVIPKPETMFEPFPQSEMLVVDNPLESNDVVADSLEKTSLFYLQANPKVMFSVKDKFRSVKVGNHEIDGETTGKMADNIVIYHFPFKNYERFEQKVMQGGAFVATANLAEGQSWHWRRWSRLHSEGRYRELAQQLIGNPPEVDHLGVSSFNYQKVIRAL